MGSTIFAVKANLYVKDFKAEAVACAPCSSLIWKCNVDGVSRHSFSVQNGYPFSFVKRVTKSNVAKRTCSGN